MSFKLEANDSTSVLIETSINNLQDENINYSIKDIIKKIKEDKFSEPHVVQNAVNHYENAEKWGVFSKDGTPFKDLVIGGKVTIIDVSCYATIPGTAR